MLFSAADYADLRGLVFRADYAGYRPNVVEAPNGDGKKDPDKRFAHVAAKYCPTLQMSRYASVAHDRAMFLAYDRLVSDAFMPCPIAGALRVLEYPPGATSAMHTDFDLFTINCYRNEPNAGLPAGEVHIGELGELLGLGPATPHEVLASPRVQHAIVYFAIPSHAAVLPSGQTVGAWIEERIKRSRYYK
jgi:hypothetical protein